MTGQELVVEITNCIATDQLVLPALRHARRTQLFSTSVIRARFSRGEYVHTHLGRLLLGGFPCSINDLGDAGIADNIVAL